MAAFQAPFIQHLAPGPSILVVALGVSLLASVLFGTLPAIRISRRDVAGSLRGGTAQASARVVGYHARDLVVFVELALAVALIVVAAMWLKLFAELQRITPVFAADHVVAARVQGSALSAAAEAIAGLPGVTAVTAASSVPGGRSPAVQLATPNGRLARAGRIEVQPAFFRTVGLPILRGRTFEPAEANAKSSTVIVSEAIAADLWPNEDPLGATVNVMSRRGSAVAVVIGVCADAWKLGSLAQVAIVSPDIYVPFDPDARTESLVLARTSGGARALVEPIEAALNNEQLGRRRANVVADDRQFVREESLFLVRLIGAFGLVALGLAATGIFGVLSQSISQRTAEFGVRMALGASSRDVLRMVIRREAKLIVAAIATGAAGTVLVSRAVFAELVTVSAADPRLWITVAALCGGVAAVAAALATYRIVRLDPWTILRNA